LLFAPSFSTWLHPSLSNSRSWARHQRIQNRIFASLFVGAAALMASYPNGQ
jgi:threonine/homoserine/homoserine lactone efflux protein